MEKLEKFLDKYSFVLIILLSIPAVWALLVPGFFGASDDLHVAWLFEMDKLIKLGQFPPRFVPDLSFGFGYPLFNFVFPLPFYLAEVFHLVGFSLVDSVKIIFLLTIPFSVFFMYKLIRVFSSPILALAGALVYGYTPYRSTDIYVRGAFGEALPFVFMPILALSFLKIASLPEKRKNLGWVGISGLSLGCLILSHDITAYMFFPACLLLAILLTLVSKKKMSISLSLLGSIVLGLLVSIYFWLPALLDSTLMKYDTVFDYVDHFPTLQQLLLPFWGWGASVAGPHDGISFSIGTFNLVLFVLGILFTARFWGKYSQATKVVLSWSIFIFSVAFLMMNFRSIPLWSHIPLLPYFQFPWRFLILTTFTTPLFIAVLEKLSIGKWIGMAIGVLVILFNFYSFQPHDFLGRNDSYYINKYIPEPIASSAYMQTQEEYLRLPKTTQKRPVMVYPRIYPMDNVTSVSLTNSLDATIQTSSTVEFMLNYSKYEFPGWSVKIDGNDTAIASGIPFGQVSFIVPSGNHTIAVSFEEPLYKRLLDIISLGAFIASLVLILQLKLKRNERYN